MCITLSLADSGCLGKPLTGTVAALIAFIKAEKGLTREKPTARLQRSSRLKKLNIIDLLVSDSPDETSG